MNPCSSLSCYTRLFPVLLGAARFFSFLHPKLRTFFSVRRGQFKELEQIIHKLPSSPFRLWVHAASVGEFEQARPIVAALKEKHPDILLFVSFLSDSGYNARKNFQDASAVFYLPPDTRNNAKRLLSLIKPDIFLLMRYDFWPNHLLEAKKCGVTLILAAAALQQGSPYFNPMLKGFYRTLFHLFNHIYTVSAKDTDAFRQLFNCQHAETAGDPRFDQVFLRSRNSAKVAHLKPVFENRTVLVAGSVWDKDEVLLLAAWKELDERPALVLVPHEVNPENMARLYGDLQLHSLDFLPVSTLNATFDPERQILVIDQTGYLAELYSLASIAYVGGGFGVNVHNTLEPAVHGIPVLFGPRYHNSPETEGLIASGGAIVINDQKELAAALKTLTADTKQREKRGKAAETFVKQNTGGISAIAERIEGYYTSKMISH
ncbi:MAG: 3-deoxy-D-manno-octulosonic acid transferase [Chlorobiaceae bacterium]|nr:3-deoxy-D-manno-octulosonic acid transferase [Chlorobiaceae bacterium]NTV15966.1 3-deoxy-D-manno-octulosonic acid transferase [Chlorobiaceae bacterium]